MSDKYAPDLLLQAKEMYSFNIYIKIRLCSILFMLNESKLVYLN